ncbi:MAG: hypothetical protein LBK99_25370, partial [Opitutaceae bacterium]|nr:hypothetical protein [Opitutaceae bacterium]
MATGPTSLSGMSPAKPRLLVKPVYQLTFRGTARRGTGFRPVLRARRGGGGGGGWGRIVLSSGK